MFSCILTQEEEACSTITNFLNAQTTRHHLANPTKYFLLHPKDYVLQRPGAAEQTIDPRTNSVLQILFLIIVIVIVNIIIFSLLLAGER